MNESRSGGLRAQKRQETGQRLEEVALSLATKRGLEAVTVEQISAEANVSSRTFFNYFDSKEDALLGLYRRTDQFKPPANLTGDLLSTVVGMVVNLFHPITVNPNLRNQRMKLIRRYPQLLERRVARLTEKKKLLIDCVEQIITQTSSPKKMSDIHQQAAVISLVTVAGVGATIKEWATTKKRLPTEKIITEQTVTLIRKAIDTLV